MSVERSHPPENDPYQRVVFALIENGQILLEHRLRESDRYHGYTIIPGGSVEPGETPEQAVRREALEEFGISPIDPLYAGTVLDYDESGRRHDRHVYIITRWNGKPANIEAKNTHITVPVADARIRCTHPVSQRILPLSSRSWNLPNPADTLCWQHAPSVRQ